MSFKMGGDPTRISANILMGVGFIGGGVLIKEGVKVAGISTASLVWVTASVGMACGAGEMALAGVIVAFTLAVMVLLPLLVKWIESYSETRGYRLDLQPNNYNQHLVDKMVEEAGLKSNYTVISKSDDYITVDLFVVGGKKKQDVLLDKLLNSDLVKGFCY